MPFVYEKLDPAAALELRKKIPAFHHVLSSILGQVVDRERDIVFVVLGGSGELPPVRGEPPTYYALFWHGQCVAFEGYDRSEYSGGRADTTVDLIVVKIPLALRADASMIMNVIREAMLCQWREWLRKSGRSAHLTIQFPEPTYY